MNALAGPDYDLTQHGWEIAASPRHADVITTTGPMTRKMREAAMATLEATPQPCVVVAVGDCAIGAGPWSEAPEAGLGAGIELRAAVQVSGCPPSPDAILRALSEAAQSLDGARAPSEQE